MLHDDIPRYTRGALLKIHALLGEIGIYVKVFLGWCYSNVILSGVNGNVIMSGYGNNHSPDDERAEASRDYPEGL